MAKRRISLGTLDDGAALTPGTALRGGPEIVRETAKAFLLAFEPLAHGSRETEVWIPKSQLAVADEADPVWGREVSAPAWWIQRNNLWRWHSADAQAA